MIDPSWLEPVKWLVRESIALILAGAMFFIYVKDARLAREELHKLAKAHEDIVSRLLEFGHARGEMEARIATILERIEIRLRETTVCPVTSVSNEVLMAAVSEAARRTQPGAIVRASEIARALREYAGTVEESK